MITDEQALMLTEAGFEPCWVRDLREGDEIAIVVNRCALDGSERLAEMRVTQLWTQACRDGVVLHHWIGVEPTGLAKHRTYGGVYECWRKRPTEAGESDG